MSFRSELKRVLELEREGEARLTAAREEARLIVEAAREEARGLFQVQEREIARERERRLQEAEEEIGRVIGTFRHRYKEEERRLRAMAEARRKEAVGRILCWLREEP